MLALTTVTVGASVLMSGATATAADDVQPNIIGGHAPTLNYPPGALVSVKYDAPDYDVENYTTCGASLVDEMHIRIAAHCVTDMPAAAASDTKLKADLLNFYNLDAASAAIPAAAKKFWVRIGSLNREEGGLVAQVTGFQVHKDWNWGMTPDAEVSDVAIGTLDQYADVYPLPIAPRQAQPGDQVYMIGWGKTLPNMQGQLPTQARELTTTVQSPKACKAGGITRNTEICLKNPGGNKGACNGDSGAPVIIVIDRVLYDAGILSRSTRQVCGQGPDIATSTPAYDGWIYDQMSAVPPRPAKVTVPAR